MEEDSSYITGIRANTTIGFKYFDFKGVTRVALKTRAYIQGDFEIRTAWNGPVLGTVRVDSSNFWEEHAADVKIPDGVSAFYLTFTGTGSGQLRSVRFA